MRFARDVVIYKPKTRLDFDSGNADARGWLLCRRGWASVIEEMRRRNIISEGQAMVALKQFLDAAEQEELGRLRLSSSR